MLLEVRRGEDRTGPSDAWPAGKERSEAGHESDRNGSDPWLLELALATLPIAALALWRRRWLQRHAA